MPTMRCGAALHSVRAVQAASSSIQSGNAQCELSGRTIKMLSGETRGLRRTISNLATIDRVKAVVDPSRGRRNRSSVGQVCPERGKPISRPPSPPKRVDAGRRFGSGGSLNSSPSYWKPARNAC